MRLTLLWHLCSADIAGFVKLIIRLLVNFHVKTVNLGDQSVFLEPHQHFLFVGDVVLLHVRIKLRPQFRLGSLILLRVIV